MTTNNDETRERGGMTPGKWHTDGNRVFQQNNPGGRKMWIAEVFADCGSAGARANAKAIAALPDLIGALQGMVALIDNLMVAVPWGKTFDLDIKALNEAPIAARAALKKAGVV